MISATNGHDVKYSASEKLQNEVDEWLKKKGNKVKQYKCTIKPLRDIPKKRFNKGLFEIDKPRKDRQAEAREERLKYQQPLLQKYFEICGNDEHCWAWLSIGTGGAISKSHAYRTFKGHTSIKDAENWGIIKDYILKKVEEYETSKKETSR